MLIDIYYLFFIKRAFNNENNITMKSLSIKIIISEDIHR